MSELNKKMRSMDIILIILGISVLIFTTVMIWLYLLTGGIPDTLCTYFFISITGECGAMGIIKSFKEKYKEREWELEDKETKKKETEENKKITLQYLAEQEVAANDRTGSERETDSTSK